MVRTGVDSAIHQLRQIQSHHHVFACAVDYDLYYRVRDLWSKASLGDLPWYSNPFEGRIDSNWEEVYLQVQSYERELMFLKMIFLCFATWDDANPNLRCIITSLDAIWEDLEEHVDDTILWKPEPGKQDWELLALLLEDTIQQCKHLVLDYCHVVSDPSLHGEPLTSDQALEFLQIVLQNMDVLVRHKAGVSPPVKIQIDSLKVRLILSESFFRLITVHEGINCEELRAFRLCLNNFANDVAFQAFVLWAKSANEHITFEAKINELLCAMQHKILKPCGSDVTPLYLGALMTIKLQPSDDTLLQTQVVEGFVDLHLDSLVAVPKDDLRTVREGLIFPLTFMTNPPEWCDQNEQLALVCNQIHLLFTNCTYLILSSDVFVQENFTINKMLLSDFAEKFGETMQKVKELFVKIPDPSTYDFPRTNGLGYYDCLLHNLESLREKLDSDTTCVSFPKKHIMNIEEELLLLRPFVKSVFELQKEHQEFEETWSKVINLAYRIEHVINACLVSFHPIWYNMVCLCDILDQIQDVKRELEKVGNCKMHDTKVLPLSLQSFSTSPQRKWSSTSSEEVISLEEETAEIIEELIWGYKSLGTISIIGMGGVGKTTLAKKVFDSKSVKHHFHKVAFCTVSQVHNTKNLFVDILCGVTNCKRDQFDYMAEEDLAHLLWKCLSGQKYLIIMDDIWDIKAWDEVKRSFPDNNNGSKIIFTTRERRVALNAGSSLHDLRPLSDDESIKLLHLKVFGKDACPSIFSEVGKTIAKNCKGLPLSIVVVAGLLASNKTSSSWWEEIAEATSQFVGQECKEIVGLSYKHLPEHLKSCFLYMRMYEEDEMIWTRSLMRLWIGEGFVNKSMTKSLRRSAKECLSELVDRNLVIAVNKSGRRGIKTCRLHDLIHDFCRRQAEEDNFLWLKDRYAASNSSNSTMRNRYRVSVKRDGGSFDDIEPTVLENLHSFLRWDSPNIPQFVLGKLKLVQVLHLEGESEFLSLHHLVHLRYIYISPRYQIWEVPELICNLWNLETFILRAKLSNRKLPKTIWKMKRLRHLQISWGFELDVDDDDHEGVHHLLENIEFLSILYLLDCRTARAVLQRLPNIQKLDCTLEGSEWTCTILEIDFLCKLESLSVFVYDLPRAVTFPSSLKRLCWSGEQIMDDILSAIAGLPCLETLTIESHLKQWNVEDEQFPNLKRLLVRMYGLEQWNVSFDSFSCLEQLVLSNSSNLEEIPACFAVLPTLQRIEVYDCKDKLKSSALQVQKEQKENGNEVRLKINGEDVD